MSHLDDPGGKIVGRLKLDKVRQKLIEYLGISINKATDCIGKEVEGQVNQMDNGEVLLLENLRFHKEEKENDDNFAQNLAKLGDIYINDAFAESHRVYASIVGVPEYLPKGAGLLLGKEVKIFNKIIKNPQKPLVAIIGGAKVETKAKLIDKISEVADSVLIGGLIKKEIKEKNIQLKCPQKIVEPVDEIKGKDIGPETIELFKEKISLAKTLFWNGPLGLIEEEQFSKGSKDIAQAIIEAGAFSVIGGGDTIGFINRLGLIEKFSYVSTGGGAMLAFLSGEELPGLKALEQ